MKIIVKGKNIKLNYKFCVVNYWYFSRINFDSYEVRQIKHKIEMLRWGDIISNEEITYETYFELKDLDYRLNIGEKFNGNIVESVEGTDDGNIEEKNKIKKDIDDQIEELQRELERVELRIQIEELRNCNKSLNTKTETKKWYKFWQ